MTSDAERKLLETLDALQERLARFEAVSVPELPSVSMEEAMRMMQCSRRHIGKLLASGVLHGPMVGRRRRIATSAVLRHLSGGCPPAAPTPARRRSARIQAIPIPDDPGASGA